MSQFKKYIDVKEGWAAFFLALLMVLTSAYAINQAELTQGLDLLMTIGLIGFVSGFFLARSAFSSQVANAFSFVYGVFFIVYILGVRFYPESMMWDDRVADMLARQSDWLTKAFEGGTSRDSLIFVMHTSLIFWVLGYSAAWYTSREQRIWRVILPSGLVLFSVVYYYYGTRPLWLYLVIYVVLAFMYVSRTYLAEQEMDWAGSLVRYERSITYNFLTAGFLMALVALTAAWASPSMQSSTLVNQAVSGVNSPIRRLQDNWTRLFSSLRSYGTATSDTFSGALTLGGPRTVGNTLVMDVYVEDQLPYAYWQALVYESYEGGAWTIPDGERRVHIPDEGSLDLPETQSRQVLTQTIRNYLPNAGTLYGLPQMMGSDRQMYVTAQTDAQGNELVSMVQSRYVLQQSDIYDSWSAYSTATAEELRTAGQTYPDWTQPYLQVPDSITDRTLQLADDLAAPYNTQFDMALAMRDYLRQTITYNDQIDAPPADTEPIDYVLFELQEGYCNYYASAMVIMLRSQGVPARMVAGYAAGEFVEDANVYRVRAKDAHTWVEAYFPGYGWVQFEPTASIPTVSRPQGGDLFDGQGGADAAGLNGPDAETNREDLLPEEEETPDDFLDPADFTDGNFAPADGSGGFSLVGWISSLSTQAVASASVTGLSLVALFLANILNTRVESNVEDSYERLSSWSRWLGHDPQPSQTPYERADMLSQMVPDGRQSIRSLTHQFVQQTFGRPEQKTAEYDPRSDWKQLRPKLIREVVKGRFANLARQWRALRRRLRFWY